LSRNKDIWNQKYEIHNQEKEDLSLMLYESESAHKKFFRTSRKTDGKIEHLK
jgi:hypothetical protein